MAKVLDIERVIECTICNEEKRYIPNNRLSGFAPYRRQCKVCLKKIATEKKSQGSPCKNTDNTKNKVEKFSSSSSDTTAESNDNSEEHHLTALKEVLVLY